MIIGFSLRALVKLVLTAGIAGALLMLALNARAAAPETTPRPDRTTTPYVVSGTGDGSLHVRSCPRLSCRVLSDLEPGTRIEPSCARSGQRIDGTATWLRVRHEGHVGYASARYLRPSGANKVDRCPRPALSQRRGSR